MNILILSVGTRNKVVQYFKNAVNSSGMIIATDMSELAPAIYVADKFYKVPKITEAEYIDVILDICKEEHIDGVFSLIDPELMLLAEHMEKFAAVGTTVIGSSAELCDRANDKMKMYKWLCTNGYRCAKSYESKEEFYEAVEAQLITYPVFVKPVCGSASIGACKVYDKETLETLFARNKNLMIQEYLEGQEIGADVYVDMISGEPVSAFTKIKLAMRAGETDKAVSFKDEKLFKLIEQFVNESGWRGPLDIDLFAVNGEYYISEVNPRFGGGYPHAHECGCNHVQLIVNNLRGLSNNKMPSEYREGVYMMKYSESMVR